MVSTKDSEVRATLQLKAASGCPALIGRETEGYVGNTIMNCQGNGERACVNCPIRGRMTPKS